MKVTWTRNTMTGHVRVEHRMPPSFRNALFVGLPVPAVAIAGLSNQHMHPQDFAASAMHAKSLVVTMPHLTALWMSLQALMQLWKKSQWKVL